MGDEQDEALVLRGIAHRMSQGIEIKTHTHMLRGFRNTFLGTVSRKAKSWFELQFGHEVPLQIAAVPGGPSTIVWR